MPDLDLPIPGVTPGPEWATKNNAALNALNDVMETGRLSQEGLEDSITAAAAELNPEALSDNFIAQQISTSGTQTKTQLSTAISGSVDPLFSAARTQTRNEAETSRALAAIVNPPTSGDVPTITWGTVGNVAGLTRVNYTTTLSRFIGVPSDNTTFGYRNNSVNNGSVTLTAEEFTYDGNRIRYEWRAINTDGGLWQVYIDGRPIKSVPFRPTSTFTSGTIYYMELTFPDSRSRHFRIEHNIAQRFGFAYQSDKTMAPAGAGRKRIIVQGDSYVGNALDMGPQTAFPNYLGRALGHDVHNCGQPGSGYTTGGTFGQPYGDTARIAAAAAVNPDYVIIYGTVNVGPAADAATYETTAATAYQRWGAATNAPLIVVGPTRTVGNIPAQREALRTGVRAAAVSASNVVAFIDPVMGEVVYKTGGVQGSRVPWNWGTGKANDPKGDGNNDYVLGKDAVHPTDAGQRNIAGRLLPILTGIIEGYPVLSDR